jgi:hypothetical protein
LNADETYNQRPHSHRQRKNLFRGAPKIFAQFEACRLMKNCKRDGTEEVEVVFIFPARLDVSFNFVTNRSFFSELRNGLRENMFVGTPKERLFGINDSFEMSPNHLNAIAAVRSTHLVMKNLKNAAIKLPLCTTSH